MRMWAPAPWRRKARPHGRTLSGALAPKIQINVVKSGDKMCAVSHACHERTRDEETSEAKWGASVCGAFGVFPTEGRSLRENKGERLT